MKRIPAFRLIAEPLEAAAAEMPPFQWAGEEIGKRHRLGGDPGFIQDYHWPTCPECKGRMTFLAQIDSLNDEFNIADCGLVYVFYCFECIEATTVIQSY